ncbi:MAG: hypothetical protein ACFFD4_36910 [Candidatus Odinarchaeota archaeon]
MTTLDVDNEKAIRFLIALVVEKSKNASTKLLISALEKGGVEISSEKMFRYLVAAANTRLETLGMRIKWIPYPDVSPEKDRWVLVSSNTKPEWMDLITLKCLACGIILAGRNENHIFSKEELTHSLPIVSDKKISRSIKKLLNEHYFKLSKEKELKIAERTFREINISHFLAALSD